MTSRRSQSYLEESKALIFWSLHGRSQRLDQIANFNEDHKNFKVDMQRERERALRQMCISFRNQVLVEVSYKQFVLPISSKVLCFYLAANLVSTALHYLDS